MRRILIVMALLAAAGFSLARAEEQKKQNAGPPPALVVTAVVETGTVEPTAWFVGSIFYARVSELAAEVEGLVEQAAFEEGQRVRKGAVLVRLGTDILASELEAARASYDQALAELQKAQKDLARIAPLFEEESISEAVYDEAFFKAKALEQNVAALKAAYELLELRMKKKAIRAPFPGVVVAKSVERGEWVGEGGTVAVLADHRDVDAVVDVPGDVLGHLKAGQRLTVQSGGQTLPGTFLSIVPRGDIATRTFSVKVRLRNTAGLVEGMEARVELPAGGGFSGLLVPRDAVIFKFGRDVVFVVEEGKARMLPVRVTGYQGLRAGVEGPGLHAGQQVVVKGNERVQDGQPVALGEK
jgi:RND family efflux transporter MFP subunit